MVIVQAGHVPFAEHHHRRLLEAYARRHRTLYLEMEQRGGPANGGSPARKRGTSSVEVAHIRPRLPGNRFSWVGRSNWRHGVRSRMAALRAEGAGDRVLIVQTPGLFRGLRGLGADLTAYLIVDDYVGLVEPADKGWMERAHLLALRQADLVWAISAPLLEAARRVRPDALATSTGVDFAAFSAAAARAPAAAVAGLGSPRIGIAGKLNDRVDWALLEVLARSRPDWTFVVVGPVHLAGEATRAALPRLDALANFRRIGAVPPDELPAMVSGFDVGLVVYRPGDGTLGINPLKLYQYLAAGKPVVATPLPVFADFRNVVRTASTAPAMAQAIAAALDEDRSPAAVEARQERARAFDWERIAAERLRDLERACAARRASGERDA